MPFAPRFSADHLRGNRMRETHESASGVHALSKPHVLESPSTITRHPDVASRYASTKITSRERTGADVKRLRRTPSTRGGARVACYLRAGVGPGLSRSV